MSTQVDNRVVEFTLDADQFSKAASKTLEILDKLKDSFDFSKGTASLEKVYEAAGKIDFSGIENAVDNVKYHFTALEVAGITVLSNIVNTAFNAGKRIVSALTIDPIKTGFQEYETKIDAIQTILANTADEGATLKDVNAALDELNIYADKTIYNFTEMTKNIGTFTAAGIKLETATRAIQGMANVAAVSGANSTYASRAMYQMSQALATGTVRLQDWRSMENASMGGEFFQNLIKDTARDLVAQGKATKAVADGLKFLERGYDNAGKKVGSFRESLQYNWVTADLMSAALSRVTKTGAAEYLADLTGIDIDLITHTQKLVDKNESGTESYEKLAEAMAKTGKISKQRAIEILQTADLAEDAATKVRSFTQLWDTLKEAAQSGWTNTWQILIGDFEEAKELLTEISDVISEILNKSSLSRNLFLQTWKGYGGFEFLANNAGNTSVGDIIRTTAEMLKEVEDSGNLLDTGLVDDHGDSVKEAAISYEQLAKATGKTVAQLKELIPATEEGLITYSQLKDYIVKYTDFTDEQVSDIISSRNNNGRLLLIQGLKNAISNLYTVLMKVKEAFTAVFDFSISGVKLYELTEQFVKFTEKLKPTENALNIIYHYSNILFSILGHGVGVVKALFSFLGSIISAVKTELGKGPLGQVVDKISKIIRLWSDLVYRFDEGVSGGGKGLRDFAKSLGLNEKELLELRKIIDGIDNFFGKIVEKLIQLKEYFSTAFDDKMLSVIQKTISVINRLITNIVSVAKTLASVVTNLISKLSPIFKPGGEGFGIMSLLDWILDKIIKILDSIEASKIIPSILDGIKKGAEGLGNTFEKIALKFNIWKFLKNLFNTIKVLLIDIVEVGGTVFDVLTEIFSSMAKQDVAGGFLSLLNTILAGGLVVELGKLYDVADVISDFGESITRVTQAKLIKEIGIALGILALALILICKVPTDQLITSIAAIAGAMALLTSVAGSLVKTVGGKNAISNGVGILATAYALAALATAVFILAGAVYLISLIPEDRLARSVLAVISIIVALGLIVALLNGTGNGTMVESSKGKTAILKPHYIAKALSTVAMLLTFAAAVTALCLAVVVLGMMPEKKMWQGIKGVGIITLGLALVVVALSQLKIGMMGVLNLSMMFSALSAFVSAMVPLAALVFVFGNMNPAKLEQGINAVGYLLVGMTAVVVALSALKINPFTAISLALMMVVVSLSIASLVSSLAVLTRLPVDDINKALKAMGIMLAALLLVLTVLVIAAKIMTPTDVLKMVFMATALFIFVGAIAALTVVLKSLSSLQKPIKAFGILIAMILVFVGAAWLISKVIVPVAMLVVVLNLLALAMFTMASSIFLFAASIAALAAFEPAVVLGVLELIGQGIIALIPKFTKAMIQGIGENLKELIKLVPIIAELLVTIILVSLRTFSENAYEIGSLLIQSATSIVRAAADNIGPLIDALIDLCVAAGEAVVEKIKNIDWEAVGVKLSEIWDSIVTKLEEAIEKVWESIKDLGKRIIQGIGEGLKKWAATLFPSYADDTMASAETAMRVAGGIFSPARRFMPLGSYIAEGIAVGLSDGQDLIDKAAGNLVSATEGTIDSEFSSSKFGGPSISPVVNMSSIKKADFQFGASASAILASPVKSLSQTMYDAQSAMDARNLEVMEAVKSLQTDLKHFVAMDQRDLSLYVDGKKLASTIVNPMNRELNVIARRSEGI